MDKKSLENYFNEHQTRILSEFAEYLAFKSISAEKEYLPECLRCADWLNTHFKKIGFQTEIIPTADRPFVYAEYIVDKSKPTLLAYGHYDVQPAKLEDGWDADPFKARFEGDKIIARGSGDNKGQNFYIIKAAEALISSKKLNVNLKILLEGEEESGSHSLITDIGRIAAKIKGDLLLVTDTTMLAENQPSIEVGMRGLFQLNVKLSGTTQDLHSGTFGGLFKNPAAELAKIVAKFYNPNGSIAIPGFYDDIPNISDSEKAALGKIPYTEELIEQKFGAKPNGGEQGYSMHERRSFRPTLEINGFNSGYGGAGSKTIIPATAQLNITGRTVRGQNSARCLELITDFIIANAPKDMKLEIFNNSAQGQPLCAPLDLPANKVAADVLYEVTGVAPLFNWHGATIPIMPKLFDICEGNGICTGFGLDTDGWHSPNEVFTISRFKQGFLFSGLLMSKLGAA